MMKRLCALLCAVVLACSLLVVAQADETPDPIYPLDYDSLPDALEGQHHYLLVCEDIWEDKSDKLGNTDGIVLVTMDTHSQRLMFTTFSREMLVQRPDGKIGRLTYIAKNYGMDALCQVLSTHFGVRIEKYILFSYDNIQNIIDKLGGVEITVTEKEAVYLNAYRISRTATTPSMDKAGTYLFTGHAAVIYMRIRKRVEDSGDDGRTNRIRKVLSTLALQCQDITLAQSLSLITDVNSMLCRTNMSMNDMLEAAGYAYQLRGVEPEGLQLPADDAMEPITYAGMSTRQVDFEKCRQVLADFLDNSFLVADN
jgi:LCP family protein required for cell wall assembly